MWRTPEELVTVSFARSRVVMMSQEMTNWREEAQAKNIIHALQLLPTDAKLLVWCGNRHYTKELLHEQWVFREGKFFPEPENEPDWIPMDIFSKK